MQTFRCSSSAAVMVNYYRLGNKTNIVKLCMLIAIVTKTTTDFIQRSTIRVP